MTRPTSPAPAPAAQHVEVLTTIRGEGDRTIEQTLFEREVEDHASSGDVVGERRGAMLLGKACG